MTPSEAFATWIDGRRVQVEHCGDLCNVVEFDLTTRGLVVSATNGTRVHGLARDFTFRLADVPAEPKPINTNPDLAIGYRAGQEDSEAWGLLREMVLSFEASEKSHHQIYCISAAKDALKKRGML